MAALQLNRIHPPPYLTGKKSSRPLKVTGVAGGTSSRRSGRELVTSGEVRAVEPKEAAAVVAAEGYVMLDVRPVWEIEKARVIGSVHVPLFVEDKDNGPVTLLKKWVHFGYIGLWTGQRFTTVNSEFSRQVEDAVPDKKGKILVTCGEGLKSLMAISRLYEGGYRSIGWLAGGFNRAAKADFPETEGTEELQYATIGGVSYYFLKLLVLLQTFSKASP